MSLSLTSDKPWRDLYRPLNILNYKALQAALVSIGYDADTYAILEPLCQDTDRLETEKRKAKWVQFYINMIALGISLETVPDVKTCDYITGNEFTPALAGSYATYTTVLAGANNDIVFTAKEIGTDGNLISITYVVAGNSTPLTVSVAGNDITVNVATDAGGLATSTAAQIRTAIGANALANALVSTALAPSNTGAGVVTALAKTYLAGGTDY